jgi:outer membrane immunogenic protein
MRRNIGLALALALAVSIDLGALGAASAADMAMRRYTKAPMAEPVMVYNWTGCYIGGNVGGAWARTAQTQIAKVNGVAVVPNNNFGTSTGGNFVGGAQIGCDYQFSGDWVVGVQGMFDFGNIKSQHVVPAFPAFLSRTNTRDLFTVTGRVGYLFTPEVLGYFKAGGAFARVDYNIFGAGPPMFLSESAKGVNRAGWTVGVGAEWMFAPGWSVFGEYNFMDFGRKNVNFVAAPGVAGVADVLRTRMQVNQVLVGVNYKFDWSRSMFMRY